MTTKVPSFLLAGGPGSNHRQTQRILGKVIDAAGGAPAVAYLGSASGDDTRFYGWLRDLLLGAGARSVTLAPTAGAKADIALARRVLDECSMVFVSGGDVEAGMDVIARRGLSGYLRTLASRVVFCGVSAGSIMMSREWVRWPDPDNDASAERFSCLGVTPVLCDAHGEGEAWVELQALLRLCPDGSRGYGIRTEAALRIDGSKVQVVGGSVDVYRRCGSAAVLEETIQS